MVEKLLEEIVPVKEISVYHHKDKPKSIKHLFGSSSNNHDTLPNGWFREKNFLYIGALQIQYVQNMFKSISIILLLLI